MTRKETEAPSNRAPQNLHSKLPAFQSEGLQADLLFLQDLEIACTNKHLPWLCSITQSCARSVGHSEQCPWGSLRSPCPIGSLKCTWRLNALTWLNFSCTEGSFIDNDESENGDIIQRHTFEWDGNSSVIPESRGGQSAYFKCLVFILCFSHLNAAFVQRAGSISLCVLSSGTAQRRPGSWGCPGRQQLFGKSHWTQTMKSSDGQK